MFSFVSCDGTPIGGFLQILNRFPGVGGFLRKAGSYVGGPNSPHKGIFARTGRWGRPIEMRREAE